MERIEREFKRGEIGYLQAIEALQNLGWQSEDAEDQVIEWEQETPLPQAIR